MLMLSRFIEFFALFAAFVAGAFLFCAPQFNPRWRPALKYVMVALVVVVALSQLLVKDLTGKGWEDRAAHLAGEAFCAVIPQFPRCYDRTVADLNEAIQEDPHNPVIWVNRGNAYFGHDDFDGAIKDFTEALRLNRELAVAYAGRAYAYRAKGEDGRAIDDIKRAAEIDSRYASAISDFGPVAVRAYNKEKQENEEAKRALESANARVATLSGRIQGLVSCVGSLPKAPPPKVGTLAQPTKVGLSVPPSPVAAPDRDEVAALLTRARTYLSGGDVAAARLVLRRAAERDDPQAALALGGTYDPVVLKRLNIINFHSDPAQALEWYCRALVLGSSDAALRVEQLVQADR
jgi:tetratricopeptide (TPR) repeat protein